jgi:Ca2+-binding EF-hand superfamily protein
VVVTLGDLAVTTPQTVSDAQQLATAGFSEMHARHLLDSLAESGVRLADFAKWTWEQQRAHMNQVFPLMSSAKVETWLKKLRLIFYDKAQVVDQSASPPKGATEPAAAAASPAPRPKTGDDNEALNAINKAMRSINASSETWSEIAKAADGLLTYERAEEERQWTQHEAFLREHIREFGTEHLALVQLGHSEIIEDIPTNGNGSDNPSAGEPEDDRIFKLAPSKLIPQPPVKSPKAQADSAPRNQNPATNAVRKLNEPAPWKKKDKLHYLLHEQNADIHEANAHVMKASQVKHVLSAEGQAKKARARAQRHLEAATRAKPKYDEMIQQQARELAFVERLHQKYEQLVDRLLEEQKLLQMDMDGNPWDLTLGMVHDSKERHLKRKLLWHIGAAPEPDEQAISGRNAATPDRMIANELDELVAVIDADGDGLLTNDELEERLTGDPNLMLRLQALRINLALSSANTLQGNNSKTRRAMLQLQLQNIHGKMDFDGNGYIDVDELIEVATQHPDLKRKLRSLGIHLDAMLRTAKKSGATLGLANSQQCSMDILGFSSSMGSPPVLSPVSSPRSPITSPRSALSKSMSFAVLAAEEAIEVPDENPIIPGQ